MKKIKIDMDAIESIKSSAIKSFVQEAVITHKDNLLAEAYLKSIVKFLGSRGVEIEIEWPIRDKVTIRENG